MQGFALYLVTKTSLPREDHSLIRAMTSIAATTTTFEVTMHMYFIVLKRSDTFRSINHPPL